MVASGTISVSPLVVGHGIHSDVIDAVPDLIGLIIQPVGENVSSAASADVERPC